MRHTSSALHVESENVHRARRAWRHRLPTHSRWRIVVGQIVAEKSLTWPGLFLQLNHNEPDLVQRLFVGHSSTLLIPGDRSLEVVVVHFLVELHKHLRPQGLRWCFWALLTVA